MIAPLEHEPESVADRVVRSGLHSAQTPTTGLRRLAAAALLIAGLYFGRPVLIPLALALLITLILNPLVGFARRLGFPRAVAIAVVSTLAFSTLGALGWGALHEFRAIGSDLPRWENNLRTRVAAIRKAGTSGTIGRLAELFEHLGRDLAGESQGQAKPESVVTHDAVHTSASADRGSSWLSELPATLGFLATQLATAGLVVALVLLLLAKRDDVRNRILRLVGVSHLPTTTKFLDEAIGRVGHYLLAQVALNGAFGLLVGIGLWLMGMPYVLLWGTMAALLRFIPYVGSMVAVTMPALMSLAALDGWHWPFVVAAYILTLDIICVLLVEPLLYGNSAGVTPLALLLAIAFWTAVWGPVGLLLATPLTVCVLSLARHVSEMDFLRVLMSDDLTIDLPMVFYQRLLAREEDDALDVIRQYASNASLDRVYEDLLIPTLIRAKRNMLSGSLSADDRIELHGLIRDILDNSDAFASNDALNRSPMTGDGSIEPRSPDAPHDIDFPRVVVCGCPTNDDGDELILAMLAQLATRDAEFEIMSHELLLGEMIARVAQQQPNLVCIAALPPGGTIHLRHLVKRLHAAGSEIKVLIVRPGSTGRDVAQRDALRQATGADEVSLGLAHACEQIAQLRRLTPPTAVGVGT